MPGACEGKTQGGGPKVERVAPNALVSGNEKRVDARETHKGLPAVGESTRTSRQSERIHHRTNGFTPRSQRSRRNEGATKGIEA